MNILGFIGKIFKKNNIMVLLYVALTFLVGSLIPAVLPPLFFWVLGGEFQADLLSGVMLLACMACGLVYVSVLICCLCPIGEAYVRRRRGCYRITDEHQIGLLAPLYHEVLDRAGALDPSLSGSIRLYMTDGDEPAAVALGRRSIAVTSGIFGLHPEKIKAMLARELGHVSQMDPQFNFLIIAGTVTSFLFVLIFQVIYIMIALGIFAGVLVTGMLGLMLASMFFILHFPILSGTVSGLVIRSVRGIFHLLVNAVPWSTHLMLRTWSQLADKMMARTRRQSELDADAFAFRCGYGQALYYLIGRNGLPCAAPGPLSDLLDTYPEPRIRIERLRKLCSRQPAM